MRLRDDSEAQSAKGRKTETNRLQQSAKGVRNKRGLRAPLGRSGVGDVEAAISRQIVTSSSIAER
jgi:hypothetical protein